MPSTTKRMIALALLTSTLGVSVLGCSSTPSGQASPTTTARTGVTTTVATPSDAGSYRDTTFSKSASNSAGLRFSADTPVAQNDGYTVRLRVQNFTDHNVATNQILFVQQSGLVESLDTLQTGGFNGASSRYLAPGEGTTATINLGSTHDQLIATYNLDSVVFRNA